MKKLLLLLILTISLIFSSCSKEPTPTPVNSPTCVNSAVFYNRVNVYNSWGNIVDFVFTYDYCQTCDNNFNIQNNSSANVYYNFSVKQQGIVVYSGWFNLPAYGSVYFNDAFSNCNSNNHFTEVLIW